MTTTTTARPAFRGAGRYRAPEALGFFAATASRGWRRLRPPGALFFFAATAASLVHALDDAFVHRGAGLGLGQHALAGTIALVAAVVAVLAFPSLRPGLRSGLSFGFGVLALVNGMLHVRT